MEGAILGRDMFSIVSPQIAIPPALYDASGGAIDSLSSAIDTAGAAGLHLAVFANTLSVGALIDVEIHSSTSSGGTYAIAGTALAQITAAGLYTLSLYLTHERYVKVRRRLNNTETANIAGLLMLTGRRSIAE